jgi:hypothetical protein
LGQSTGADIFLAFILLCLLIFVFLGLRVFHSKYVPARQIQVMGRETCRSCLYSRASSPPGKEVLIELEPRSVP